jgi:hypothetical protein
MLKTVGVLVGTSGFTEVNYTQLTELYQKYRDKGQCFACCNSYIFLCLFIDLCGRWRARVIEFKKGSSAVVSYSKWNDK